MLVIMKTKKEEEEKEEEEDSLKVKSLTSKQQLCFFFVNVLRYEANCFVK